MSRDNLIVPILEEGDGEGDPFALHQDQVAGNVMDEMNPTSEEVWRHQVWRHDVKLNVVSKRVFLLMRICDLTH